MFLVNGVASDHVSISNRSFQYGDGCFSTILVREGKPQLWDFHRQRMSACLKVLRIDEPEWTQVLTWIEQLAQSMTLGGIKVHVCRGAGSRGYGIDGAGETQVTVNDFAYPNHYQRWQQVGVALGVSRVKLGHQPILAGHKHNNRLEQVLIKADAQDQGELDTVVLDIDERVIETSIANLFWVNAQGQVCTPDLRSCGVAGVMRRQVLTLLKQMGVEVKVDHFMLGDLMQAKTVWMTNSLMEIVPISSIDGYRFAIDAITRQLQEKLSTC
ncbi:aminodeoxychorismate lyase [Vibrio sp. SCSIO 43136]|uniref:aminodeoxychorismate lyase n=1 Tax=Vibrio sp. SCSIO 43136 TaxID=2819101 RepID=UPI0020755A86|nr:aminodeoxychorismate lyase [Vibrio sp. SCSIO 43136]USD64408.1 aminodeoxychorismate lyase [Vibrio sp. SCSIO 43136]